MAIISKALNIEGLIKEKYGQTILQHLIDVNGNLEQVGSAGAKVFSGKLEPKESRLIVQDMMEKINFKGLDIDRYDWVFDLPAWSGNLFQTPQGTGKIMVIGMEPHIEHKSYQLTYHLDAAKTQPKRRDKYYQNLGRLIYGKNDYMPNEMFESLYNTDLCHFAPKGLANQVSKIKKWKKIRERVANFFLRTEISIVKPSIIITHGRDAQNIVGKIMATTWENEKELLNYGHTSSNIPHLSVYHLGSGHTQRLWNKRESYNEMYQMYQRVQAPVRIHKKELILG